MSTKLNAEELASKRHPDIMVRRKQKDGTYKEVLRGRGRDRTTCARTIREVAQPIADERDELREALKQARAMMAEACSLLRNVGGWDAGHAQGTLRQGVKEVDAILAKYPKP